MKLSVTSTSSQAAGETTPFSDADRASSRWSRRQLMIRMAAAGISAPAMGAILARTTAAQEATPAGEHEEWCAKVTAEASPTADAEGTPVAGRCVAIEAYDIYFEPNLVTIPANTPVTIALPNEGAILHNFSITDHKNPDVANLDISIDLPPGEVKSVTVEADPGSYYFYCDIPGHEAAGMFGFLIVEEGAEISAETATVTPPAG